jgi:hypothetical protein
LRNSSSNAGITADGTPWPNLSQPPPVTVESTRAGCVNAFRWMTHAAWCYGLGPVGRRFGQRTRGLAPWSAVGRLIDDQICLISPEFSS